MGLIRKLQFFVKIELSFSALDLLYYWEKSNETSYRERIYIVVVHLGIGFSRDEKCPHGTYYPLAQLRWRRGYSIWFVRPSVHLSVRHTLGWLSYVRFSSKAAKLWILKPMLIYSRHIVVVHLVFSLSENPFIWSELRSKLRQFLARKGLLNEVLCALLLQRGKVVDFKTYADLLLTYCSCAPRIQFVRKSIYLVRIEVKT